MPAALVRLSFLVQRNYSRICAQHDLSPAQAQLMCVIKDEARGMSELAQMLGLERPGLTGLVDRIERRGLLHRQASSRDRRAVTVALTPEGKRITEAFFAEVSDCLDGIVSHLPADDRADFEQIAFNILLHEQVPAIFGQDDAASAPPPS